MQDADSLCNHPPQSPTLHTDTAASWSTLTHRGGQKARERGRTQEEARADAGNELRAIWAGNSRVLILAHDLRGVWRGHTQRVETFSIKGFRQRQVTQTGMRVLFPGSECYSQTQFPHRCRKSHDFPHVSSSCTFSLISSFIQYVSI